MEKGYQFTYLHGQSIPHKTLAAKNDEDFFNNVLPEWEHKTGFKHIAGSVKRTVFENTNVPEPIR